jgi:hypothetical protein
VGRSGSRTSFTTAGIVIEVSLGLKTNTPLPDGLDQDAIEQLMALLRP